MGELQDALLALQKDPLDLAIQNVAQYQLLQSPEPVPRYDLNNLGQYFQYQPVGQEQPGQAQPQMSITQQQVAQSQPMALVQQPQALVQPQEYRSLRKLYEANPGMDQGGKIQYRGKMYSANNPILSMFPSSPHFKPSGELLMKAQEWENQNVVNQAVQERQRRLDAAQYFTVSPDMINSLPQGSVYRSAFQPGQQVPISQLQNFQKEADAQQNQQAIRAMMPMVEEALARVPDDNVNKPLVKGYLQMAIESGQVKNVQATYDYIKSIMPYVTPKAQTKAQQMLDQTRLEVLRSQIAKNQAQLRKLMDGGGGKGKTGASKSQLASHLEKTYSQYLQQQQMAINNGTDNGDVLGFSDWVQSQNYTNNGKPLSGAQMWQLYNQNILDGVEVPEPTNNTKPVNWDLEADKYLKKRGLGSLTKTIDQSIKDPKVDPNLVAALLRRYKKVFKRDYVYPEKPKK